MFDVTRSLSLILALFFASNAYAQSFSGPHVEAVAGLNHDSRRAVGGRIQDDSLIYGAGGGYDFRTRNIVLGVLGEVSGTTNKNCQSFDVTGAPPLPILAGRSCTRGERSLFAGARLGYVLADRTLGYVLGGYDNVRAKYAFDGVIDGAGLSDRGHETEQGFRVGAGLEQAISDHAFIKAEYRYSRTGPNHPTSERHQIVTGIGYRF